MLDNTTIDFKMTAAWRDHISPGDILSFRFPLAKESHAGHPKSRPCLVLETECRDGERYVLLAYGTTSRRRSNVGYEVHARRRTDYVSAGLHEPTRFVGKRRLLVPLKHSGFVICTATGSAVLGTLEGDPADAMNAVRGRIQAERDILDDRRQLRRRRRNSMFGRDRSAEREPRLVPKLKKKVKT